MTLARLNFLLSLENLDTNHHHSSELFCAHQLQELVTFKLQDNKNRNVSSTWKLRCVRILLAISTPAKRLPCRYVLATGPCPAWMRIWKSLPALVRVIKENHEKLLRNIYAILSFPGGTTVQDFLSLLSFMRVKFWLRPCSQIHSCYFQSMKSETLSRYDKTHFWWLRGLGRLPVPGKTAHFVHVHLIHHISESLSE